MDGQMEIDMDRYEYRLNIYIDSMESQFAPANCDRYRSTHTNKQKDIGGYESFHLIYVYIYIDQMERYRFISKQKDIGGYEYIHRLDGKIPANCD